MESRSRSAMTLAVLSVLCVFGLVFGVVAVSQEFPEIETPTEAPCEPREFAAGSKVRLGEVTVSVFNAGSESGNATETLKQLMERGFARGTSGNAPKSAKVSRVQVWTDEPNNPAVRLVARQFGKGTNVVRTDKEAMGPGVVVVVGNGLGNLSPSAPKLVVTKQEATVCSPPLD